MFYLIIGVLIGNATTILLFVIDHLLWLKYAHEDANRKTHVGYGFYLAFKSPKKKMSTEDSATLYPRYSKYGIYLEPLNGKNPFNSKKESDEN